MLRCRYLAVAAGLATIASLTSVANADEGIKLADGEVFLDYKTGQFGGRLESGADKETTLALVAAQGSQVSLAYWPLDNGQTCPARGTSLTAAEVEDRRHLERRAAISIGKPIGGQQKFIAKAGPFFVGRQYCFYVDVVSFAPVEEADRALVGDAIRAGLQAALDDALAQSSPKVTPEQIRHAVAAELDWLDRSISVVVPDQNGPLPVSQALASLVTSDAQVMVAVETALQRLIGFRRQREQTRRFASELGTHSRALSDPLPATVTAPALARSIQAPAALPVCLVWGGGSQ